MNPSPSLCIASAGLLFGALLLLGACSGSPRSAVAPASAPVAVAAPITRPVPAAEADVQRLASPDFVTRSHAADRLVAAGEGALPALGRAGEGETRVHGTAGVSTTRPVIRSILSDLDQRRLYAHLDSPYPVVRREAAEELGRRGQWSAVPRLIERLEDGDVDVRATAASSLRRLTNRFFGYDAQAHAHVRGRAADRWRRWWGVQARVSSPDGTRDREG